MNSSSVFFLQPVLARLTPGALAFDLLRAGSVLANACGVALALRELRAAEVRAASRTPPPQRESSRLTSRAPLTDPSLLNTPRRAQVPVRLLLSLLFCWIHDETILRREGGVRCLALLAPCCLTVLAPDRFAGSAL